MRFAVRSVGSILLATALLAVSGCASLREPAPRAPRCVGTDVHAFDFWIGEWDIAQRIRTADGDWIELPAHTSVSVSPDRCVLIEHWDGEVQFFWEGMAAPEALVGFSVRTFDPAIRAWRIYWLDSRHPAFDAPYVGAFENGRGEFRREIDTPAGRRSARIVFSDIGANSLEWALETSADGGASWTPLWRMSMRRR